MEGLDIKARQALMSMSPFGGGGHSRELLSRLGPDGRLVAFDQDEDALRNIVDDKRLLCPQQLQVSAQFLEYHHINKVDGILADLGVSSHHFDDSERVSRSDSMPNWICV